ncbi:MAG: sulfotransferase domain-containing protein [Bacteroidia bacterium]|nr:sulfotransferase domain-containing protein [Bacteroidia bacterium]
MKNIFRKVKKLLKILFIKPIYRLYKVKYVHTIWLLGSGRSGTTWIASLINYDETYRELFEPFHIVLPELKFSGFTKHHYLKADAEHGKIQKLAKRILNGQFYSPRPEASNTYIWQSKYKNLLVKDVFANLLAYNVCKWNNHIKPIFLIRNPYAVALSKCSKKDWYWMTDPKDFLAQDNLVQDFLKPHVDYINEISDDGTYLDKQILIWSVINFIPLTQFAEDEICITFYEDWTIDPNAELLRIQHFIDQSSSPVIDIKASPKFSRPSKTTATKKFDITSWKSEISKEQLASGNKILEHFGLHMLYDEASIPRRTALVNFRSNR